MKKLALIPLGLFCLLVIFSCTNDPQKKGPDATASAFLDALREDDYEKAKTFCTPSTANKLNMAKSFSSFGFNPYGQSHTIVETDESGDYARVYYTLGNDEEEKLLKLRNTDGKWEVIASKTDLSVDNDNDNDIDLDFGDLDEGLDDLADEISGGLKTLGDSLDSLFTGLEDGEIDFDNDEDEDDGIPTGEKYLKFRKGKDAKATATAFLNALKYSDYDNAKRYASKGTADVLDMQFNTGKSTVKDFSIVDVIEDGDYRRVIYMEEGLDSAGGKELKLGPDSEGNWEVIMSKSDFNDLSK